jgi:FtsZ-binding cell division protein ZapB
MLRREAEELRRKMEQLSRSQSSAQPQQGQQGQQGQQSSESQGQRGQQGPQGRQSSGGQSSALNRAIERLTEAARDMQNAGSTQNQGTPQSDAEARRAAERLREAREMLAGERRQQAGEQVEELARKTQQLAEEQKNFEQKMRQALGSMVQNEQGSQGRPSLLQQPGTSRRQTEPLQTEEKKLIEELTQIEKEMQNAARDMAATQPSASSKLRDALAEAQKQDLGMKMGWSVEVMRQGYAPYALTRQPAVTEGLNQLRDRVHEAQGSMNRDQAGGNDLEAALSRAERLREQLQQLKRQGRGQKGQGEQQQGEQPGQQSGQQPGQQPGGQQPSSTGTPNGAEPGSHSNTAEGRGGVGAQAFGGPGLNRAYAEGAMREGIRDLAQLDQMLRGNREVPHEISRDVQDLVRQMQGVDPRLLAARPERLDQIVDSLLTGVEEIELKLRRLADNDQSTGNVRSGASQPPPPGYAEAVAEYFRRLANHK